MITSNKRTNITSLIKTNYTNLIKSIGSFFDKTEPIIQWIDIIPILILSLAIYFVSINQYEKKNAHQEDEIIEQKLS